MHSQLTCFKRFIAAAHNFDVEVLSQFARMFCSSLFILDVVCLHISISELLAHGLAVFEDYDCETVGNAVTHQCETTFRVDIVNRWPTDGRSQYRRTCYISASGDVPIWSESAFSIMYYWMGWMRMGFCCSSLTTRSLLGNARWTLKYWEQHPSHTGLVRLK